MKLSLAILLITCLIISACNKNITNSSTPAGIENKIKHFSSIEKKNPPVKIWQYEYNGKTVYFITSYCCDMFSELYDENANLICNPDGGITGHGDGRCKDFFDLRKNEKLIWEDKR